MKKTLSILIIAMLVLMISITPILAVTSFTIALSASSTTVERGKTVDVTISLKNFTANETGINAIMLVVDYDKSVFETLATTDFSAKGGWGVPTFNSANGKLATDNAVFMSENHDFLTIKFTAKSGAALGNTVVTIKDVNAADGVNDIYPANQSITLTVKEAGNTIVNNNTNTNTNTNVANKNPKTGIEDYTVPAILGISALALLGYARYRKIR